MTEECVPTSPLRGNPTIQKRFTGFMDYAAGGRYKTGGRTKNGLRRRREKRRRFPRFTGFLRSGEKNNRIYGLRRQAGDKSRREKKIFAYVG